MIARAHCGRRTGAFGLVWRSAVLRLRMMLCCAFGERRVLGLAMKFETFGAWHLDVLHQPVYIHLDIHPSSLNHFEV